MATSAAVVRAVDRVVRAADHDDRSLRLALLDALRRSVAFDAYAWVLTDPETEVGSAPLADVPCVPELPRLIRLKYLTAVNRWTALPGPVATLGVATGGRPGRSRVWRELLSAYGVTDVASVVFRDRWGCWGFLDLWRTRAGEFAPEEAERLAAVTPAIAGALRRSQARTFEFPAHEAPQGGPAVLVLSPELDVRAQTPETEAYLRQLVPPEGDARPIPAGAYNVGAQLLATEAGIDDHPARARVHLGAGVWLTLRAARMTGIGPVEGRDLAVTIEHASPAERVALAVRVYGLSDREGEVVGHLVTGAATKDVARRLFVSEHTVQDHLKSIFAKTGVRSRRELLARVVGR